MATYRFQRVFTLLPNAAVLRFLKHRLDDFLTILKKQLSDRSFVIGERLTVVDLSMIGYLQYPKQETGYDFAVSHPAIYAWLQRVGALPGWRGSIRIVAWSAHAQLCVGSAVS
jgi:glutathione S-transferase